MRPSWTPAVICTAIVPPTHSAPRARHTTLTLVAVVATVGGAPATASTGRALDYLTARQQQDGAVTLRAGEEPAVRAAQTAWAALAAAAAGEDPGAWGNGTAIAAIGPRPDPSRTIAHARWIMAAAAARAITPTDRQAALADLTTAISDPAGTDAGARAWTTLAICALAPQWTPPSGVPGDGGLEALQRGDGGWGPALGASDVLTTSLAIQALRCRGAATTAPALVAARGWLRARQRRDGGFSWAPRAPTTATETGWAALAIAALGESPGSTPWRRRGGDPLRVLAGLQGPDGGVGDRVGGPADVLATAIAARAFAAAPLPGGVPPRGRRVEHGPQLVGRSPAPDTPAGPMVVVRYRDAPTGTGIDTASVRVWAHGQPVIVRGQVTALSLRIPREALGRLPATIAVQVSDRAGNTRRWQWRIAAPAGGQRI